MNGRIYELLKKIRESRSTEETARCDKIVSENELELYLSAECSAYDYLNKRISELNNGGFRSEGLLRTFAAQELKQAKCELKKWLLKDMSDA